MSARKLNSKVSSLVSDSYYRTLYFLQEVYARCKGNFTKSEVVFKGNNPKCTTSLAFQFGISKIYTVKPLIELNFIESYPQSNNTRYPYVKWIGEAPTLSHVVKLKDWNDTYAKQSKERSKQRKEDLKLQEERNTALMTETLKDAIEVIKHPDECVEQTSLTSSNIFELVEQLIDIENKKLVLLKRMASILKEEQLS